MGHGTGKGERLRLLVSSCLLGNRVRYDGGHKFDPFVAEFLRRFFDLVPVCPEFECGMSVPREPVRLVLSDGEMRVKGIETGNDYTPRITNWARKKITSLCDDDVYGFILKTKSPSCGVRNIPVFDDSGCLVEENGRGLFTSMVLECLPNFPVADEEELLDPDRREAFFDRVFVFASFGRLRKDISLGALVNFLDVHDLLFYAYDPDVLRQMRRMLDDYVREQSGTLEELAEGIRKLVDGIFDKGVTGSGKRSALEKALSVLSNRISSEEAVRVERLIERYSDGSYPFQFPAYVIRFLAESNKDEYVTKQFFLDPKRLVLL